VSKSDEESVEEVGEPVIKVLNDIDPEKFWFLANPTLTFRGCKPRGQPSSYNQISQKSNSLNLRQNRQIWIRERYNKKQDNGTKSKAHYIYIKKLIGKYCRTSMQSWKEKQKSKWVKREDKWIPVQPCVPSTYIVLMVTDYVKTSSMRSPQVLKMNEWMNGTVIFLVF